MSKAKSYCEKFNALLSSKSLAQYLEPERKLDVTSEATLRRIEQVIRTDDYFIPVNALSSGHDIPEGIHVTADDVNHMEVPNAQEVTPRRYRLYYDTPSLDAFRHGIEIRIEFPKATEHGHARKFKQVVKLGKEATEEDPTFHRLEFAERLMEPIPSFDAKVLDGNKRLSAFLKDTIDCDALRPLQLLTTVRSRLWCRTEDDPDTIVEFGFDRGRGMTVTGHRYPILQVEPEVIRGDEGILEPVVQRLVNKFGDKVMVNLHSKPTPGFDDLAAILHKNPAGKAFLAQRSPDEFSFIKRRECAALFPAARVA